MHRARQAQANIMSAYRVAGLVRPLVDLKALAAVAEHLRHERKTLEPAVLVERPKDLLFAQNLHPLACTERGGSGLNRFK